MPCCVVRCLCHLRRLNVPPASEISAYAWIFFRRFSFFSAVNHILFRNIFFSSQRFGFLTIISIGRKTFKSYASKFFFFL